MEEVKKQGMESLFVPYEIALALKELGFDEPCFGYYNTTWSKQNELLFPQYAGELENWNEMTHLCSAPLYQQAFSFFRKKYQLYGETPYYGKGQYYILILDYNGNQVVDIQDNIFWSSEEAELECLKKLIELCKNN